MTWFKSLIMRQNSPLLLIDDDRRDYSGRPRQSTSICNRQQVICRNEEAPAPRVHSDGQPPHLVSVTVAAATLNATTSLPNNTLARRSQRGLAGTASQPESSNNHPSENSYKSSSSSRRFKMPPNPSGLRFLLLMSTALIVMTSLAFGAAPNQQYFEAQPDAQHFVASGSDIRLRCLVRYRQGECVWMKDGRVIAAKGKRHSHSRSPDDGDCSLTLNNVTAEKDDGVWQCQVLATESEVDNGLVSRQSQLVVLVAPERPQIRNLVSTAH